MDNVTLRQAEPNDSEFAYRVKKAALKEYVEQVYGWDEDEQRRLHQRRFDAQDVRIISVDGDDVGVMALAAAPDCLKVNQIFLLPAHQGKGVGAECMRRTIEQARQSGLPVRLRVLKVNPRALAFYQRLGFVPTGETDTHIQMEAGAR